MQKTILLLTSLLIFACPNSKKDVNYEVIPLPNDIKNTSDGDFVIKEGTKVLYPQENEKMKRNAGFLAEYIKETNGINIIPEAGQNQKGAIILQLGLKTENPEAYKLTVCKSNIIIQGKTEAGIFYGIQTLRKSVPLDKTEITMPSVVINDAPRFAYRGMMLDVARHTFPFEFIKKYIDILALHNINRFHWHITDDQGWRIEIKKYPKLTEIGSKRKETVIGKNTGKYDGKPYGGFFTQEQVKEIVAYAAERYITVIPEIDMPGHMMGALAAYPELGCTGGPYNVWTQWGVSDEVLCAGNPKTYEFIKDVLNEIMDIFPSEYIHVGGDECPKARWKKCPKCQVTIRNEGLNTDDKHIAEERLQSHFMEYAEKIVNERGRKIIGWDEILEGGIAPNATIMSWRGTNGGIEAAKQNHDAIMTPTEWCYFDYYQTKDTENEPLSIGGYVPIKKVYNLEPMPAGLTHEQQKHIIGTQANLWTEYIENEKHAEYMTLPRMAALCEVQWTKPEKKNYKNFSERLPHMLKIYDKYGYNYAKQILNVQAEFTPNTKNQSIDVKLSTIDNADIFYTIDGSNPTKQSEKYAKPIKIKENAMLKAIAIRGNESCKVLSEKVFFNKATAKPIELLQPIAENYKFDGAQTLVDGLKGGNNYKTGRYIGFCGNDMEAVIDLQKKTEISSVEIGTCVEKGDWVFDMRELLVEISNDGKTFKKITEVKYPAMTKDDTNGIKVHTLKFGPTKTRFVKITAKSENNIPEWHSAKGNKGYLFVDEITIN